MSETADLFPGFEAAWCEGASGRWFARVGGPPDASPVLLLHGFPQTHAMWHRIAPELAKTRRIVCLDLKGYGWSAAPADAPDHSTYAKRTLAREIVALMERLGHVHFAIAGHDRGARVAYRLALDDPGRVERLALLDIVPTAVQWKRIEADASIAPHWPFLARPAPEPETAILKDPDGYFEGLLQGWSGADSLSPFDPRALDSYRQAWNVPERIAAMCADYRAGGASGPDRAADEADIAAGRVLEVPTLILASTDYLDKAGAGTALDAWRSSLAPRATGRTIASGHFLAEENPQETLQALRAFFDA